jgi:hypothetical protein
MLANDNANSAPSTANENMEMGMKMDMDVPMHRDPIPNTVEFPYGFPSGRYRIFEQMKHGVTIETGVFDATAQ